MPDAQISPVQMIFEQLKAVQTTCSDTRVDVGVIKKQLEEIEEHQDKMSERLRVIEQRPTRPLIDVDRKTLLILALMFCVTLVAITKGLPEGVWKMLLSLITAGLASLQTNPPDIIARLF